MLWKLANRTLNFAVQGCVMGIVNVTPDSFSDGGEYLGVEQAADRALEMLALGAGIIDIGGESTRPGAAPVTAAEEMRRVLPVIERITAQATDCVLSIDTSKAEVAQAALERGAAIINDVTALAGDPGMPGVAARYRVGVVLMHMQGTPLTMQNAPHYDDPVGEVRAFLGERFTLAVTAGIDSASIALDAGIGFGKTVAHNLTLLRCQEVLTVQDRPMVVGISRKAFLGKIAGSLSMEERLWPALALTALLREKGARVFRTHDVGPTLAALRAAEALLASGDGAVPTP